MTFGAAALLPLTPFNNHAKQGNQLIHTYLLAMPWPMMLVVAFPTTVERIAAVAVVSTRLLRDMTLSRFRRVGYLMSSD